jgi:hypothetical protein
MPANIILVHDDPAFIEGAAAALSLAGHKVVMFREPMEALETGRLYPESPTGLLSSQLPLWRWQMPRRTRTPRLGTRLI